MLRLFVTGIINIHPSHTFQTQASASLTPKISISSLLVSLIALCVFPPSNMLRTFHIAILFMIEILSTPCPEILSTPCPFKDCRELEAIFCLFPVMLKIYLGIYYKVVSHCLLHVVPETLGHYDLRLQLCIANSLGENVFPTPKHITNEAAALH